MPSTQTLLAQASLANSIGTLYTVPANRTLTDESLYFWNDDSVSRNITLYFVPSGGSADDGYVILPTVPLASKNGMLVQPKQAIATGGTIRGYASSASKVSCQISGDLVDTSAGSTPVTRLAQTLLGSSLATIYTATPAQLDDSVIWLANLDSAPHTVSIEFIPSGGSSGLAYRLLGGYTITANGTLFFQPRQRLDTNGTIRAFADTANKVALAATGIQR